MTLEDIAVMSAKVPQELLISYIQNVSLIYLIAIFVGILFLVSVILFLAYWLKNGLETLDEGTLTIIALFLVITSLFTIGASFQAFESFIFYFNCYFNPLVMILQAV